MSVSTVPKARKMSTMSSLILRRWLRFELESRKPTAMSGTARMEMLTDGTIFPPLLRYTLYG